MMQSLTRSMLLCALLSCAPGAAQQVVLSHELVHGPLGPIDDIEVDAVGEVYLSFPTQGFVGRRTITAGTVTWVPVATGFVLAMALEPGGAALWTSDWNTQLIKRVDLATGQVTRTISAPGFPIDLAFQNPSTLLVGCMDIQDTIAGTGSIHSLDLSVPGAPMPTLVTGGLPGAVDMEFNSQGRLFVVAFGSATLDEVDPVSGQRTPLVTGLVQPSDLLPGPGTSLFVCTLLAAELLQIDPDPVTPALTQITALLGGTPGPGCEDMAVEPSGQMLVSMNNGFVRRVVLQNSVVQQGTGLSAQPFTLQIDEPGRPGWNFQVVASFAQGITPVPGTPFSLPVVIDPLFIESLNPLSPFFSGFTGQLDAQGRGQATVNVPQLQSGTQISVIFGVVMWDFFGPIPLIFVPDFLEVAVFAL